MKDPKLYESNLQREPKEFVECGCCGMWHRNDFWGDCRDDNNRFDFDDLPHDSRVSELGEKDFVGKELLEVTK